MCGASGVKMWCCVRYEECVFGVNGVKNFPHDLCFYVAKKKLIWCCKSYGVRKNTCAR